MWDMLFDFAWIDQFKSIFRRFHRQLDQLYAPYGLTAVQAGVLISLNRFGEQTLGELSGHLSLSKSNLSTLCKRMARDGWVDRVRDGEDERRVYIRLTQRAQGVLCRVQAQQATRLQQAGAALTQSDKLQVLRGLETLDTYLRRLEE
nr:MarR family transcriptional regulator [Maliibacterium massiliense]